MEFNTSKENQSLNQNPLNLPKQTTVVTSPTLNNSAIKKVFIGIVFIVLVGGIGSAIFFGFKFAKNQSMNQIGLRMNTIYQGEWMTMGEVSVPAKITVLEIKGTEGKIKYEWGDENFGGHYLQNVQVKEGNKGFSWSTNNILLDFNLTEYGSLNGVRDESGKLSKINMTTD